jgi:hypothetical protein
MALDIIKLIQRDVILDACSVYSLYATSRFADVLRWIPGQVYLASYVEKIEVKQLFNPITNDFDIPIDLLNVKNMGLLRITKPQAGTESLDAVNFASAMSTKKPGKNTGEAITGAIAKSRNMVMVTDDVNATDFLIKQGIYNSLTTTLHIIECWSRSTGVPWDDVKHALEKVRLHARYGPPPNNHPLLQWWQSYKIKF